MHRTILTLLFLLSVFRLSAAPIDYRRADSLKVESLLAAARKQPATTNWMLHFGRQLRGLPYVAHTLEVNADERLVVNLRQMDCTTYVETVMALALSMQHQRPSWAAYTANLRQVRYAGGIVSYPTRQHYFTYWAEQNRDKGLISFIDEPRSVFSATQKVMANWMTTHVASYKMLAANRQWLPQIRAMEQSITGRTYPYLPQHKILNTKALRAAIHDGDILAIITAKAGLETTHLGIAVWHADGLHLLNASSIHKKVVEEPKTLYRYMHEHRLSIGIRAVRVNL